MVAMTEMSICVPPNQKKSTTQIATRTKKISRPLSPLSISQPAWLNDVLVSGYGFNDSVYAFSCDQPLIAGVWATV